jgi:hypothetical protein
MLDRKSTDFARHTNFKDYSDTAGNQDLFFRNFTTLRSTGMRRRQWRCGSADMNTVVTVAVLSAIWVALEMYQQSHPQKVRVSLRALLIAACVVAVWIVSMVAYLAAR